MSIKRLQTQGEVLTALFEGKTLCYCPRKSSVRADVCFKNGELVFSPPRGSINTPNEWCLLPAVLLDLYPQHFFEYIEKEKGGN